MLEVGREVLFFEGEVGVELPRLELRSVRRFAGVVLLQPKFQILGAADISLAGIRLRLEKVDVVYLFGLAGQRKPCSDEGRPPSPGLWRIAPAFAFRWRCKRRLERVTRLELATSSLARRCSTTELHPQLERDDINSTLLRGATF